MRPWSDRALLDGRHVRPVAGRAATEADEPPAWDLDVPYKRTKLAAERLALGCRRSRRQPDDARRGRRQEADADGAHDRERRAGPDAAYVGTTGLNVVDVRDVARGHALALEHGEPGQRYLLGGVDLSLEDLFAAVARLADVNGHASGFRAVAEMAAAAGIANRNEVRLARLPMYFIGQGPQYTRLRARPGGAGARPCRQRGAHEGRSMKFPLRSTVQIGRYVASQKGMTATCS